MEIDGSYTFAAPRQPVWECFNDREVLERTTPGCESLTEVGDYEYEAEMKLGVAAVQGRYKGTVSVTDREPPSHYKLNIEAQGNPGWIRMSGVMDFVEDGDGTTVTYEWDVQVGGPVAGLGQRVLKGVATFMIGQFFKQMDKSIGERVA